MSSLSPCACVFLPFEESCYDCFVAVWEWHVESRIKIVQEEYKIVHPFASSDYMESLRKEIRNAAFTAAWKNYQNKRSYETETTVVKRAILEAKENFMAARCFLLETHIDPTIECQLAKHFLMTSGKPDAKPYFCLLDCRDCKLNVRNNFPPRRLHEWMAEEMLGSMYGKGYNTYEEKSRASYNKCRALLHYWLDATPEERGRAGITKVLLM